MSTYFHKQRQLLRKSFFAFAIMAFSEVSLSFGSNLTPAPTRYLSLEFCYGNWLALSLTLFQVIVQIVSVPNVFLFVKRGIKNR